MRWRHPPMRIALFLCMISLGWASEVQAGRTITGTVTSADSGPIVGGYATAGTPSTGTFGRPGLFGPDGAFRIEIPDIVFGTVTIGVNAFEPYHYTASTQIQVYCQGSGPGFDCGTVPPVSLSLHSAYGNVAGTVQDAEGRGLPGVPVSAVPVSGGTPFSTTTDSTGSFRFPPQDPAYPMFGRFFVPENGTRDFEIRASIPGQDPPLPPVRVTVRGGEIAQVTFGGRPAPPPENRPTETAQGPPPPDACVGFEGQPINITTGNMYTQQEDLAYPSAFGRFAFPRTYNSQSTHEGPLGLGWSHPFDFALQELRPGVIRVRNGAGNVRFYELVPGSPDTYRPAAPARDTSTLIKHAGGYTEMEREGLKREFDLTGTLLTITNRTGWTTTLTSTSGRLTTVTDPGGRTFTFTYTGERLTRVEGPGGLFAQYTYDAQGRLIAAADALGPRWTYTYTDTTPSRLTRVRDANGHLVEEHTYDSQGRVIATTGAEGVKALTLEYLDSSHTRVTDSRGRVTTYTVGVFGDLPLVTRIEGPCPCGSPDSTFEYDPQGRAASPRPMPGATGPPSPTTRRAISPRSRMLSRTRPRGRTIHSARS